MRAAILMAVPVWGMSRRPPKVTRRSFSEGVAPGEVVGDVVFHQVGGGCVGEGSESGDGYGVAQQGDACGDVSVDFDFAGGAAHYAEFGFCRVGEYRASLLGELGADPCEVFASPGGYGSDAFGQGCKAVADGEGVGVWRYFRIS